MGRFLHRCATMMEGGPSRDAATSSVTPYLGRRLGILDPRGIEDAPSPTTGRSMKIFAVAGPTRRLAPPILIDMSRLDRRSFARQP